MQGGRCDDEERKILGWNLGVVVYALDRAILRA